MKWLNSRWCQCSPLGWVFNELLISLDFHTGTLVSRVYREWSKENKIKKWSDWLKKWKGNCNPYNHQFYPRSAQHFLSTHSTSHIKLCIYAGTYLPFYQVLSHAAIIIVWKKTIAISIHACNNLRTKKGDRLISSKNITILICPATFSIGTSTPGKQALLLSHWTADYAPAYRVVQNSQSGRDGENFLHVSVLCYCVLSTLSVWTVWYVLTGRLVLPTTLISKNTWGHDHQKALWPCTEIKTTLCLGGFSLSAKMTKVKRMSHAKWVLT